MYSQVSVSLGNLLLSLSDAMDLASPELSQHQLRTAFITLELCRVAGLPVGQTESIFTAALLHDIGALTPEEKINIHRFELDNPDQHCILGEIFFNQVEWLRPSAKIVRNHHKPWQEHNGDIDTPDVLGTQILLLADVLERRIDRNKYILHQDRHLISKIQELSDKVIHRQVVEYFCALADREEFWLDLASPRLYSMLQQQAPYRKIEIDLAATKSIAELFRYLVDFRSPFTARHSTGVSISSAKLAELFGLTHTEIGLMEVAGSLHDIGKMAVPNEILEKPGPLNAAEQAIVRKHTYMTYMVLSSINGLERIAHWAAFHHEKLDGSGYPFHHTGETIDIGARILVVADIFTALLEDRPYRKTKKMDEALNILRKYAKSKCIDAAIVDLVIRNHEEIYEQVRVQGEKVNAYYQQQFAGLR